MVEGISELLTNGLDHQESESMHYVIIISFALLLGACDDTIVGEIRQIENPTQTLVVMTDTVEEDASEVMDSVEGDSNPPHTEITDSITPSDTATVDTTPETVADTRVEDTSVSDTGHEVEATETTTTVDTIVEETIADTAVTPDTSETIEEVDTPPHECEEDLDCDDQDECTVDYCEGFSCGHEDKIECVTDSDNDGFLDFEDYCRYQPEFYDFFEDDDGCPEEDQDHDGYTALEGDCGDDPSLGNDPASFCWNEYDGYNLRIHFGVGADERPSCDFYLEDELVEAVFFFETNGAFLIGPQVDGGDTPDDEVDQDCDGETDEPGEYGLTEPDCYWWSFEDGSEEVSCWWMEFVPTP